MIHFFVPGIAQPAGSERALPFGGKLGGRSIVHRAELVRVTGLYVERCPPKEAT